MLEQQCIVAMMQWPPVQRLRCQPFVSVERLLGDGCHAALGLGRGLLAEGDALTLGS